MSPSAYITVRIISKKQKRYVVRYRIGGRYSKLVHAGSFKTQKDARERRDFVISEIAAGRDPRATLSALARTQEPARTVAEWGELYKQSRIDHADSTAKGAISHVKKINETFGTRDPATITPSEVSAWIGSSDLKPSTLRLYYSTLRLLLDYAGVEPNPAKHHTVRLPRVDIIEVNPPTAEQFLAMLERVPRKKILPLIVIEQTAMTVGETNLLTWGDVDEQGSRFRLRRATVKAQIRSRARWVQVPRWLMDIIADTCPVEDRTETRRVFPGFNQSAAQRAMERACIAAGIPHAHPHDLRHRRLSLWHGQGIPAKQLAERAGHSKASMTLDVYSHVMPLDEASQQSLEAVLVRHG